MDEKLALGAAELGRRISDLSIDPVDLAQAQLDAIDRHPMRDRIYVRLTPERAMAAAESSRERARAGTRLSPLDGVPVSWKDLFDTAGVATEAGTRLLSGRVPTRDAKVVANAALAGLVPLGKTHMSELAFSGLGYNPKFETSPCVNDEGAVAGGSSSGAAASVAFGLAAAGIGTDTGGSVRVPSAWNDLVGLKTTSGRLSLEGVVPLCPRFDTVGPLARSVEDAALLLAILEGTPSSAPDLAGASVEGARLARLVTVAEDDLRDAPRAAHGSAVDALVEAGALIADFEWPPLAEAMDLARILYSVEAYGIWGDVIEASPDKMFDRILERFRSGKDCSGPDYVAAWRRLAELREEWARDTAEFDAVIMPTCPILPPSLEGLESGEIDYDSENLLSLRNTRIGNLMGCCGLTLPTGTPSCGLQLLAAPRAEERLLRLGRAVEMALA